MARKHLLFMLFIFTVTLMSPVIANCEELPQAADLLKDIRETYNDIDSYSCTVHRYDIEDKFVKSRVKESRVTYKAVLNMLSRFDRKGGDDQKKPGYMQSLTKCMFIKPFTIQASMDINDYVPGFIEGGKVLYRPEINPYEIFFKEPNIGMMIRQEAGSDSSVALINNWTYDLMETDCVIANNGDIIVKNIAEYNNRNAYIVEMTLGNDRTPWSVDCSPETYGVPKPVQIHLNRELGMMSNRIDKYAPEKGVLRLWVDTEKMLIVRKEMIFGNELLIESDVKEIKLNQVNSKKMLRAKRPGRKWKK